MDDKLDEELEHNDLFLGEDDELDEKEEDPLTMGFHEEGFEPESDF